MTFTHTATAALDAVIIGIMHQAEVDADLIEPGTALDVPAEFVGMSVQAIFDAQDAHEREEYYARMDAEGIPYEY